jgi:excisionase family DNA binding protein
MVMVQCAGLLAALGCIAWTASGPEPVAPSEPERERLLTIAEVAARLAIPKAYAYELVRRGALPAIRVGTRYVRVPEGAFAEWVAKGVEMRSL